MKRFHVKILTKLGSTQYKEIQADSEEDALRKAETKFPLHKEIEIVEKPQSASLDKKQEKEEDPEFKYKLTEVKLNSREKKAKAAKKEGLGFIIGGVLLQLALLVFFGFITLWLAVPIIWGASRITYGNTELNRVIKERESLNNSTIPKTETAQ